MPRTNATQLRHYVHYPLCGFCQSAWDVIYQRLLNLQRESGHPLNPGAAPLTSLTHCRWGGCDPDIWDYVNMQTGWPRGWKVSRRTGRPNLERLPEPPSPYPKVFHLRAEYHSPDHAAWRRTSTRLTNEAIERKRDAKAILSDPGELDIWNEPPSSNGSSVDLNDPELWG